MAQGSKYRHVTEMHAFQIVEMQEFARTVLDGGIGENERWLELSGAGGEAQRVEMSYKHEHAPQLLGWFLTYGDGTFGYLADDDFVWTKVED